MFEQEINDTIQRITRDVLQDRTVIPLTEILEEQRIPERFTAFFETEARWWIYTESVARARDRRFDFSHPELGSLLNYLEQVQVRHARFERDDFTAVLDSAVKLTYNYLCRPQTTLKWYVFRGEPTKSIGETLLRMDAFVDYPYFRTVFGEWVERKKSERPTFDSISSKEFERIIRRIDDQILLSCTIDDLLGLMKPLFDFIGKGDAQSIPIEALIVFFDDKNIRKLVDFLERERGHRSHVTHNSFVILMEELLTSADDAPDTDFSSVYQDDALDQVVREHLGWGGDASSAQEDVQRIVYAPQEEEKDGSDSTAHYAEDYVPDTLPGSDDEEGLEDDRWEEESLLTPVEEVNAVDEVSLVEGAPADVDRLPHSANPSKEEIAPESFDDTGENYPIDSEESLFGEPEVAGGDPIFDLLIEPGDAEQVKSALKLSTDTVAVEEQENETQKNDASVEEVASVQSAVQEDVYGEEFRIAAIPEEEDLMEAILRDEEREPQGEFMETPLIFDAEEFGASDGESERGETVSVDETDAAEEVEEEFEEIEEEMRRDDAEEDEEDAQSILEEVEENAENVDESDDVEKGGAEVETLQESESEEAETPDKEGKTEEAGFSLVDEPLGAADVKDAEAHEDDEDEEESPSKSGPENVRNYIDAMLERKVVKKIFNRDRESYEETLNLLNDAETWREASRILDELFIRYDVDPYSRIAIRFTDCVYGRYLSPIQ